MAVPILLGSRVEGIIYVGNQTPRPFTDGDEASVQRLADHAGLAIQNARQFRGHMRRQEELAALYEITRVVTSEPDDAVALAAIRPLLGRLLDARHMLALSWNVETRSFALLWAARSGWTLDDAGLELRVVERGTPIRTTEYLATCQDEGRVPSPFAHGLRHALTVPLRAAGRVIGTLSLWSSERGYSRADEEFVGAVGALLALRLGRTSTT
jgi:GAF domain-containing protein